MRQAWNHNLQYHSRVLAAVPRTCGRALDVGCGEGTLTRALAARCSTAIGLESDEAVLDAARLDSGDGVRFIHADVMGWQDESGGFDFVTAVATLHHLPLEAALLRFRDLLKPGGVLAVVGLYRSAGAVDRLWDAAGWTASHVVRRWKGFQTQAAPMAVPKETLAELRRTVEVCLPGAEVRRLLYFRYWLRWSKPVE